MDVLEGLFARFGLSKEECDEDTRQDEVFTDISPTRNVGLRRSSERQISTEHHSKRPNSNRRYSVAESLSPCSENTLQNVAGKRFHSYVEGQDESLMIKNDDGSGYDLVSKEIVSMKRNIILRWRRAMKTESRRSSAAIYRNKYNTKNTIKRDRRHSSSNSDRPVNANQANRDYTRRSEGSALDIIRNKLSSLFRREESASERATESASERVTRKIAERRLSLQGLSREETVWYFKAKYNFQKKRSPSSQT